VPVMPLLEDSWRRSSSRALKDGDSAVVDVDDDKQVVIRPEG